MQTTQSVLQGVMVVSAKGRLDSNTSAILDSALSGEAKAAPKLIIDLSGVDYVSSAGLRILLKAAKLAMASKQKLALAGLAPQVREVFDVSGFTKLFTLAADPEAALAVIG